MAILSLKNGTSSIAGATVKGSFSYFSGGTRALGPSDVTGFYSGYDAPINQHTVYQIYGASGFTSTVPANLDELNYVLIRMGGTGTTLSQNITWAANAPNIFINPTPQVNTFFLSRCCPDGCDATVYSYSSSIVVGTVFYNNPQLTIPFVPCYGFTIALLNGGCNDTYNSDSFIVNTSGVVIQINVGLDCTPSPC